MKNVFKMVFPLKPGGMRRSGSAKGMRWRSETEPSAGRAERSGARQAVSGEGLKKKINEFLFQ